MCPCSAKKSKCRYERNYYYAHFTKCAIKNRSGRQYRMAIYLFSKFCNVFRYCPDAPASAGIFIDNQPLRLSIIYNITGKMRSIIQNFYNFHITPVLNVLNHELNHILLINNLFIPEKYVSIKTTCLVTLTQRSYRYITIC